jgi:hypothetical protein
MAFSNPDRGGSEFEVANRDLKEQAVLFGTVRRPVTNCDRFLSSRRDTDWRLELGNRKGKWFEL